MRPGYLLLLSIVFLSAAPVSAATELEERAAVSASMQDAFLREDFAQIADVSHRYLTTKSRTSSGLWKLTLLYAGVDDAMDIYADRKEPAAAFAELEEKFARWSRKYPSDPPRISHIAWR